MVAALNSIRAEGIQLRYDADGGAGAAGTYSGSVVLPAGAVLVDIIVHGIALWNAGTSAVLKVGDAADDDGFFTGVNLKATDLLAGESLSFYKTGAQQGADIDIFTQTANTEVIDDPALQHIRRRQLTTERTITATATLVGTAATTGATDVIVIYAFPSPVAASFTAA